MNESFEVILTHEEFTRFRELEKEHQRNCRTLRDAQQQLEKSALLCEELQATVAAHQLKIKELSKTTLRLSRKVLFEEEEHQKTQENFLAREQELLEKLLAATHNSQNALSSMQKDKESKEKVAEDNSRLRQKLAEMEKYVEGLKIEADIRNNIEKDKARQAERRGEMCEQQLLEAAREINRLKARLEQMSSDCLRLSSENSSISKQLCTLQATQQEERGKQETMQQTHSQERRQLQQQKTSLQQQVKLLQSLHHKQTVEFQEKVGEIYKLLKERSALLQAKRDLSAIVEMLQEKVNEMKEQLYAQRQEADRWRQQAQRQLQQQTQQWQQRIAQMQAQCARQLQEERGRLLSKEEMEEQLWRRARPELEKRLESLKRDKIAEWQKVLRLELQQIAQQLTSHLPALLQQLLNDR